MSHEIRTPMNAIVNFCDLLTRTELSKKQKEYLGIIRSSSWSLLEIINDILDVSKIEAGKLDFEKSPTSIREVIEDVSNMFRHLIKEKKITYNVELAPDVPLQVVTDPLSLKQVLINLVSNAFKFTEKGRISVSVNSKSITQHTAELLFCVEDTGIGISPAIQGQLFDAFTQADSSITRKYGGTGLGLTISKKIIEMMDGTIWVESTPNVGSSFFFTVKFKIAAIEDNRMRSIHPQLKNRSVLVVSQDLKSIQMIYRSLEPCGANIQTVSSAESALSLLQKSIRKNPFDLIFMDIRQPGMDGLAASKKIKKDNRVKAPAIILINVSGRKDDVKTIQETGIEALLMKPLSQSLLFDSIMNIFVDSTSNRIPDMVDSVLPGEFAEVSILLVEDNPVNQMVATEV